MLPLKRAGGGDPAEMPAAVKPSGDTGLVEVGVAEHRREGGEPAGLGPRRIPSREQHPPLVERNR